MGEVFPHLRHLDLPVLKTVQDVDFAGVDLVFCALPHGLSQALVKDLPLSVKVVDLGADFRLRDAAEYEKWYGAPHVAMELQATAVYGLTEFYRRDIAKARLVAGTGCNAATVQFALRPLIENRLIDLDDIICDLKNGLSGAGRALKENMLFTERSEDVTGYSQGGKHRHLGEFGLGLRRVDRRGLRPRQFGPRVEAFDVLLEGQGHGPIRGRVTRALIP